MTTYTISLAGICAGGNHIALAVAKDGVPAWSFEVLADELPPAPDKDDAKQAFLTLARFLAQGKSKAQVKAALLAGIDVVMP